MKQFLIFFSRDNDPLLTVDAYEQQAIAAAACVAAPVSVQTVEITSNSPLLASWSRQATIECVAAEDGQVRDRRVNPSLPEINAMLMALQVPTNREFVVFFSRANDPLLAVDAYETRAMQRAAALSKPVRVSRFSIDSASHPLWNGQSTIECVTAVDGQKRSGWVNPSLIHVDQMIDEL